MIGLDKLKTIASVVGTAVKTVSAAVASVPKRTGQAIVENKGIRRALVLWAAGLISWVTYRMFKGDLSIITTAVVAAYTVLTGVLGVVIGFYQSGRNKEDIHEDIK